MPEKQSKSGPVSKIEVRVTQTYEIEMGTVRSWDLALTLGNKLDLKRHKPVSVDRYVRVLTVEKPFEVYDAFHHSVKVLGCELHGGHFTEANVKAIVAAVHVAGVQVDEHWNGAGSGTLSIAYAGERVTKEQLKRINKAIRNERPEWQLKHTKKWGDG